MFMLEARLEQKVTQTKRRLCQGRVAVKTDHSGKVRSERTISVLLVGLVCAIPQSIALGPSSWLARLFVEGYQGVVSLWHCVEFLVDFGSGKC